MAGERREHAAKILSDALARRQTLARHDGLAATVVGSSHIENDGTVKVQDRVLLVEEAATAVAVVVKGSTHCCQRLESPLVLIALAFHRNEACCNCAPILSAMDFKLFQAFFFFFFFFFFAKFTAILCWLAAACRHNAADALLARALPWSK